MYISKLNAAFATIIAPNWDKVLLTYIYGTAVALKWKTPPYFL